MTAKGFWNEIIDLADLGLGWEDICHRLKVNREQDREMVRNFVVRRA